MIDCIYHRITYANVPVPSFTFPFFRFSFGSDGSIDYFFFGYFRYLSICRFSYFVHDSVATISFFFSFSFDYHRWLVASPLFSTGLFFDPFIPEGYPLDYKSVNCIPFTISWTGPENLSVYCTRFFMCFFYLLGGGAPWHHRRDVFFYFFIL